MGRRLTLLLLVLAGGLAALLAAMPHLGVVDRGPIAVRPGAEPAIDGDVPDPVEAAPIALSEFTETVDRPLFAADRRPPAAAPPAPVAETPVMRTTVAPPSLELSAVIIDGARRLALFRAAGGSGGSRRAEEGSEVEGWTVSAVRPDGVVLERDGATHEMVLRTFKPPPAPPRTRLPAPAGRQAEPADDAQAGPRARPRRPLRGPRQRSLRRRDSG